MIALLCAVASNWGVENGTAAANLERYFFPSPEIEALKRSEIDGALSRLEAFKGKSVQSPENLLRAMQAYDRLQVRYLTHTIYLRLRCARNRDDKKSCRDEDKLYGEVEGREIFLKNEVLDLEDDELDRFLGSNEDLRSFAFALSSFRRERDHLIPRDQEELLGRLRPLTSNWQYELYQDSFGGVDFGTIPSAAGPLDVLSDRVRIVFNEDPTIRKQGFDRLWEGLRAIRVPLAFALLRTARAGNELAQLRKFANAPDRRYFELYLDPEETRKLLADLAGRGELVRRFEVIRSHELRSQFDLESPGVWDEHLRPKEAASFSFERTRGVFHEVSRALGKTYGSEFDALLDPDNERTDIRDSGERTRYGGGFSVGISGVPSMLFVGRFSGTFKDLSIIAHEGGHAVHRQLMADAGIKAVYQSGSNFLFESFAVFDELALADYMARHARTPGERSYYLEQFLSIKGMEFLMGTKDAALEQAIYDGVADGSLETADDLDALTLSNDRHFSPWPEQVPSLKMHWERLSLAYEDPLYYVNYVYAGLLAAEYFQEWKRDPEAFSVSYMAMLENGFDAPPAALLKRFLDIDLTDRATLVSNATAMVESVLQELECGPLQGTCECERQKVAESNAEGG